MQGLFCPPFSAIRTGSSCQHPAPYSGRCGNRKTTSWRVVGLTGSKDGAVAKFRVPIIREHATGLLALALLNQAGSIPSLVRIGLEEHENHDASDRNVEPNGEREARDSAVHREPTRQRKKERREHHRQRDDGKDYVAG